MIAKRFRSGDRASQRQARLVRRTSEIIVHLGAVLDEFTKDVGRLSPEQAIALIDAIEGLERKLAVASARLRSTGPARGGLVRRDPS